MLPPVTVDAQRGKLVFRKFFAEIHDVLATFCVSSGTLQIPGISVGDVTRAVAGCEQPTSQELTGCSDGYTKLHVAMDYWMVLADWTAVTRLR